jgi:hypothetical protein
LDDQLIPRPVKYEVSPLVGPPVESAFFFHGGLIVSPPGLALTILVGKENLSPVLEIRVELR